MLLRRFLNGWTGFRMLIGYLGLNPKSFWKLFNLDRIIYYRTRSINKTLAYSKLPDGCVAIHFWDSLPTLDVIYFFEVYDRFRKIGEKDTVVDCGAHVGIFTLKAAKRAKHGLILAVEPQPLNYEILKSNVQNNGLTNVVTIKNALADKSGKVRLYLDPSLSEGSSLFINPNKKSENFARFTMVQSTTLDDLARTYGINCANVVKISVNDAELYVVKGGHKLLGESEYLAMEYKKEISPVKDITYLLLENGFKKISQIEDHSSFGHIYFRRCHAIS